MKALAEKHELASDDSTPRFVVRLSGPRFLALGPAVGGVLLGAWFLRAGEYMVGSSLVLFSLAVGVTVSMIQAGWLRVDTEKVEVNFRIWGASRITWEEIEELRFDAGGQAMWFHGSRQDLRIPGPHYWRGQFKAQMLDLIQERAKECGVNVRRCAYTPFLLNRSR